MLAYHSKCLLRHLSAALRHKGDWFEVRYSLYSLWSDFIHPARCIVYGCRNLYAYIPLIWHDRDWDDAFMFELWALKFERMARHHLLYGHHVGHEETARELRVCAALCRRIVADEYHDVDQERHDKKWGRMKMVTLPKDDPDAKSVSTRFIRRGVRNDAENKLETEEFLRWMKKGDQMKQDDLNYLAQLVSKNAFGWWD